MSVMIEWETSVSLFSLRDDGSSSSLSQHSSFAGPWSVDR